MFADEIENQEYFHVQAPHHSYTQRRIKNTFFNRFVNKSIKTTTEPQSNGKAEKLIFRKCVASGTPAFTIKINNAVYYIDMKTYTDVT